MTDRRGERATLIALTTIKGLSWHLVAREAQRPGGLDRLLAGRVSETKSEEAREARQLLRGGLARFDEHLSRAQDEIASAEDIGARLTTVLDDDYPTNLRTIFNLPPFLFYRGELCPDDTRAVAVVGTRHPKPAGVRRARRMAAGLVEHGVTVLSGLAAGIDTAAHEATLEAEGRTIAVMGTGILSVYPKQNAELAERIVEQGGVLVSQFWPSSPPHKYNFPRRNVVTSGLGQGTIVIEATNTSGARMQARLALDHGKLAFFVKSLATSEPWAQRYIEKRGAIEVSSVDDVVRRLRSTEEIESLTTERRQLVLELTT